MSLRAYVLIKCEGGVAEEVVEKLKRKEHVKRADTVFGDYDAIAYVEVRELPSSFSIRTLEEIILNEIQKVKGVLSTNTHIVTTKEEE